MAFPASLQQFRFIPLGSVRTLRVVLLLVGVSSVVEDIRAQTNATTTNQTATRTIAVRPVSPIEYFRELLAMKPDVRERELAKKTPTQRQTLTAKIQEYEAMKPEERELRLRMTQLRWYLLPLMKLPPLERVKPLATIPAADRELVESRLKLWDEIPVHLQKEFLENETNLSYFVRWEASSPEQRAKMLETFPPERRAQWQSDLSKWNQMAAERRREMSDRFTQFFELNEKEKGQILAALPKSERQQTEATLKQFEKLPPEERKKCLESFQKFASMTDEQKREFLRNAERWQGMTESEKKAWRAVVLRRPPMPTLYPPLPRLIVPGALAPSTKGSNLVSAPVQH